MRGSLLSQQTSGRHHESRSVLLLGNYRPTLTIARTLAKDGFHIVLGLDHDGEGSAQFSSLVSEVWEHPPLDAPDERCFRHELEDLLASRPDIRIVYPVAEGFVRWCAENHEVFGGRVLVASPAPPVIRDCLDKRRMVELAQQLNVPCSPVTTAQTLDGLYAGADAIGYPVVVRPPSHLRRLAGKKAIIAADREALAAALPVWPSGQPHVLIQRYARGPRHDVYFAAWKGEACRFLEVRIVRTDSIDGTGLSVDGELVAPSPHLIHHVRQLVHALNYTGIGCAQFLVDPIDGSMCFLELNPRVAGSHRCTEFTGMDLTRLAIRLAEGTPPKPGECFDYEPGQRYAWTYGDLGGLKTALSNREIGVRQALIWLSKTLASFFRADFHLTWDWRDPAPTLCLFAGKIPGLAKVTSFAIARSANKTFMLQASPVEERYRFAFPRAATGDK